MTRKYAGVGRDFQFTPLLNALAQQGSLSPAGLTSAHDGLFRAVGNRLYVFNGATLTFELKATDSDLLGGVALAAVRDITQTTGNLPVGRVTGAAATATTRLSDFATAPNATVPMGGQQLSGLAAAGSAGQAVEYAQYIAGLAAASSGVYYKIPVRAVATAVIVLSGTQTIDGVALVAGDRALVTAQGCVGVADVANGIWVAAAGGWARATDADAAGEIAPGTTLRSNEGTNNGDKLWGIVSDVAITPGTTAQAWGVVGSAGTLYTAGNAGVVVSGTMISAQVQSGGGLQVVPGQGLALAGGYGLRKVSGVVPAGSTSPTVSHNLGTVDVDLTVRLAGNGEEVDVDNMATDANTLTLTFATAPTVGQYRYIILG